MFTVDADREPFIGLSVREARFVYEYLANGGLARKALAAAGYSRTMQSPMSRPHVRQAVAELFRQLAREKGVQASEVIAETAMMAFMPLESLANVGMTARDKLRALEFLGKHLQLFNDRIDLTLRSRWQVEVQLGSLTDTELAELERISSKTTVTGTQSGAREIPDSAE